VAPQVGVPEDARGVRVAGSEERRSRRYAGGARRLAWRDVVARHWVLPGRDAPMRQALIGACVRHGLRPPERVVESLSALTTRWLVRFDPGLLGVMRLHQASEEAAHEGRAEAGCRHPERGGGGRLLAHRGTGG
jgi:hypothetical protein